jgi:hypothetical protein
MCKILCGVIPGPVPGISALAGKDVEGRNKPSHDAEKLFAAA